MFYAVYKLKNKFINQAFKYLKTTFPNWKEHEYYYKRFRKNCSSLWILQK